MPHARDEESVLANPDGSTTQTEIASATANANEGGQFYRCPVD